MTRKPAQTKPIKPKKEKKKKDKIPEKKAPKTEEKRGRKCKYEELGLKKRLNEIKKWRREGLWEHQIFEKLGISVSSGEKYKNDFPEFKEALKHGKENLLANVEQNYVMAALQTHRKKVKKKQVIEKGTGRIVELVEVTIEEVFNDRAAENVLRRWDPKWRMLTTPEKENPLGDIPAGIVMRPIDEWEYETDALFKKSTKAIDDGEEIDDIFSLDDEEDDDDW